MAQYYTSAPPGHGLYSVTDVPPSGYATAAEQNVVLQIDGKPPPPSHPRPHGAGKPPPPSHPRPQPERSTSDERAVPRRGVSDYLHDKRSGRRGPGRAESSMSSVDDRRERSRRKRRGRQPLDESTDSRGSGGSYYQGGPNALDEGTLCGSRALLSAVAVILLWGTSFTAVTNMLRLADALPAPEFYTVVDEIEKLINETRRVRTNYIDNIKGNLKDCNASLHDAIERESLRSATAQRVNAEIRDQARADASACADAMAAGYATVKAWQAAHPLEANNSHYLPGCSDADREYLGKVTRDTLAQRSATMAHVRDYSVESQSTVSLLADQLAARAAYDREYLYNKTLRDRGFDAEVGLFDSDFRFGMDARFDLNFANLSTMISCATLTSDGTCPGDSAYLLAEQAQLTLRQKYAEAESTYDYTKARSEDYINRASDRFTEVAAAFDTIVSRLNAEFPEVGGFNGIFENFNLPSTSVSTPNFNQFPALPGDIPSVTEIANQVSGTIDDYQRNLRDSVANANLDASHFTRRVNLSFLDSFPVQWNPELGWPPDYNPPPVDWSREVQQNHSERSRDFENQAAVSLGDIGEELGDEDEASFEPIYSLNISASALLKGSLNTDWFTYKNLKDAGFQFEWLLQPLRAISSMLQYCDIVWRLLQTVRILRRFWGRSALAIAPIDVTTDRESNSRMTRASRPLVVLAAVITHPLVLGTATLGIVYVVGFTAYNVYQPFYDSYEYNCTARTAPTATNPRGSLVGDGTFLTANAYSVSYNYASHEGNRLRLEGLDEYELERSSVCAAYGEKSANNEARLQTNVRNLKDAHDDTRERVLTMQRCYNTGLIDADLPFKPGGVERFDPLQQTLFNPSCDVDLAVAVDSLEDGVFDCLQLQECTIFFNDLADNSGNDQTLLFDYSRRAMCTAQWWFHSTVLSAVFSVVIWLFVNIFRFLLVDGLVRICWQWVNRGYFAYLATCDMDGTHTYNKADLADQVYALLGRIRTYGVGLVVMAVATQIPWIVMLMRFMNGLQFVSD